MAGSDAPLGKMVLDVLQCYSCGQRHEVIDLNPFAKPSEPWSHWYACPVNGDPVPMRVVVREGVPVEICRRVVADIDRMLEAGRWICATFLINDKGGVTINWVHENFPHAEYPICQELFAEMCGKHGGLPAPVAPLPMAKRFDAAKLFPGLAKSAPAESKDQAEPGNGQE